MKKLNIVRLAGLFLAMVFVLSSSSVAYAKGDKDKGDRNENNNGHSSSFFCERFAWKGHGGPKWCRDNRGNRGEDNENNSRGKKPLVYLFATSYAIKNGASTTMYWNAKRADSCSVSGDGWSGARATSSQEQVSPTQTTKYTITCANQYGSYTDSATITVKGKATTTPPVATTTTPTLSFSASPSSITDATGASSTLTWSSGNTNYCLASNGWSGSKSLSGSQNVFPLATTTYTLSCGGAGGTTTLSTTVGVIASTTPPVASGHLMISEVNYLSTTNGEWVEVHNGTGVPITMDGWTISDAASSDLIATTTIPNGGFVVITGSTTLAALLPGVTVVTLGNTSIGSGLNDGGDAVYLKDQNGATADAVSYGTNSDVFAGVPIGGNVVIKRASLVTDTNTVADWATSTTPTPGS